MTDKKAQLERIKKIISDGGEKNTGFDLHYTFVNHEDIYLSKADLLRIIGRLEKGGDKK